MGKQMEGDNRQRRQRAKDARDEGRAPPPTGRARPGISREQGLLDEEEQRVFEAVVRRELAQGASVLPELAEEVNLPSPETEAVLRRLVDHHDVVQQLPGETDGEDFGPRYRAKTRV